MSKYVLALDQGTTSSRAIVFGHDGRAVATAQQEFPQIFPGPGHVEHDPEAIWSSQLAIGAGGAGQGRASRAKDIAAIGITNQRETTILWDRQTGKPVANAIVWQSRVSAPICDALKADGHEELFRAQDRASSSTPTSRAPRSSTCSTRSPACARARRRARSCSAPSTRSSSGGSPAGACTSPTSATPAARCSSTSTRSTGTTSCSRILGVPRAMLPEVRSSSEVYGRDRRRPVRRADPDRRRRRRPAGGHVRPGLLRARQRPRTRTAPAASCCSTPATSRSRRRTACSRPSAGSWAARSRTASKARSSSPARSCSGCATA